MQSESLGEALDLTYGNQVPWVIQFNTSLFRYWSKMLIS